MRLSRVVVAAGIVVLLWGWVLWANRPKDVVCAGVDVTFDYASGASAFPSREEAAEDAVSDSLNGDLGDFSLEPAGPQKYTVHWADEDPMHPLQVGILHVEGGYLATGVSC